VAIDDSLSNTTHSSYRRKAQIKNKQLSTNFNHDSLNVGDNTESNGGGLDYHVN